VERGQREMVKNVKREEGNGKKLRGKRNQPPPLSPLV
jgi:hypothetical protein